MNKRKLQVFVSSTYTDLIDERQAAVEAILATGNIPAGMELFAAGDESQWSVIKKWIDDSDVYLLILGGRYGSVDPATGKSYTHLEYEYAVEQQKPLFAIVIDPDALELKVKNVGSSALERENPKLLAEFRDIVMKKLVKFYSDNKDIENAIFRTLADYGSRTDLVGWIKADQAVNTGLLAEEIAKLSKENSALREALFAHGKNSTGEFSGLSYEELYEMLIDTKEASGSSLFEYFMTVAPMLAQNNSLSVRVFKEMSLLIPYNLVAKDIHDDNFYSISEAGRKFYLKTLALNIKLRKS